MFVDPYEEADEEVGSTNKSGPSCSKLTMSLKFTSSDMQIY